MRQGHVVITFQGTISIASQVFGVRIGTMQGLYMNVIHQLLRRSLFQFQLQVWVFQNGALGSGHHRSLWRLILGFEVVTDLLHRHPFHTLFGIDVFDDTNVDQLGCRSVSRYASLTAPAEIGLEDVRRLPRTKDVRVSTRQRAWGLACINLTIGVDCHGEDEFVFFPIKVVEPKNGVSRCRR